MLRIILLALIGAGSCGVMADSRQTIYNTYTSSSTSQTVSCDNAALASAIGNNQIYLGARKPQISLGLGGCEGTYAASIMIGGKACADCPLLNGSFATVGDTETIGVGILWLLK